MGRSCINRPRRTSDARDPRLGEPSRAYYHSTEAGRSYFFAAPPGARRPWFRLQLELDDLAVQRAAADVEHPGGLLLVPFHRFEDPYDMGAFGIGERRQPVAGARGGHRRSRVQELDVGGADGAPGGRQRGARYRAFELANVAGPLIAHQQIDGFAREHFAVER